MAEVAEPIMTDEELGSEVARKQAEETEIISTFVPGITAFQMLGMADEIIVRKYVETRFGLRRGEFVVNKYGLPFMPVPKPRLANGTSNYRAIPEGLSSGIITHPIYWTAQEALGEIPSDLEGPEAQDWSIRMFAFLLLCGLFSPDYVVKDYPLICGVETLDSEGNPLKGVVKELNSYVNSVGNATRFDQIEYLTIDSILVGDTRLEKEAALKNAASGLIEKCRQVQERQYAESWDRVKATLVESEEFLLIPTPGEEHEFDLSTKAEAIGGRWNSRYASTFTRLVRTYGEILAEDRPSQVFSATLEGTLKDIDADIEKMSLLASTLIGPVLAMQDGQIDGEDIVNLQAFQRLAEERVRREFGYEHDTGKIEFSNPNKMSEDEADWRKRQEDWFISLLTERRHRYAETWERLFLCYVNYERAIEKQPIFRSYKAAVWNINTSEGGIEE